MRLNNYNYRCTVKTFTDDIGMEFGLDKCANATLNNEKETTSPSVVFTC